MSEKYGEIPKDLKGKIGHYWYYYKWMIIAGVCVIGLVILFLVQVVFKPKADYTIVLGMDTYVMDEQIEPIRDYLEQFAEDVNGDGKIKIDIYNMTGSLDDTQNRDLQSKRFTSEMMLGNITLVIADQDFYAFVKGDEVFSDDYGDENIRGYNWCGTDIQQQCSPYFPADLYFCMRQVEGTSFETVEKVMEKYNACKALLDKMIENQAVSSLN